MPLVMKVFEPLSTQPSPSRTAVVWMPCRSEPAAGSLIAIAVISSPEQKPGNQRACCSSVASLVRYGATTSLCRPKPIPLAPDPDDLLEQDGVVAEVADPAAAVLLGQVEAEQPVLAGLQPHPAVDDAGLLPLRVVRA